MLESDEDSSDSEYRALGGGDSGSVGGGSQTGQELVSYARSEASARGRGAPTIRLPREAFLTQICVSRTLIAALVGAALGAVVAGGSSYASARLRHEEKHETSMADHIGVVVGIAAVAGALLGVGGYLAVRGCWRHCGGGRARDTTILGPVTRPDSEQASVRSRSSTAQASRFPLREHSQRPVSSRSVLNFSSETPTGQ